MKAILKWIRSWYVLMCIFLSSSSSDYESLGYDTSTASLSSSINEYVFENGRRYHSYFGVNKNSMPTDEAEQDRFALTLLPHGFFRGDLSLTSNV
ncbi:hypothetical protein K440DRAFT_635254, partial [Wilcoxina mikolae CBS 423.85]